MARKIIALLLSLWGWAMLGLVFHYTYLYYSSPLNPSRDEYWEGVGLAWGVGLVTWIGLPTLMISFRNEFNRTFAILMHIPVVIAFIYLLWYWVPILPHSPTAPNSSPSAAPNLSLNSDPACIAFRSLSTSRFLGSVQRLGAGVAG
ncbi:hypothetical protein [Geothrix campi]|jgi:hypothetical protein|uniref:hypothetical protein n=1 Tax=Geothrix campi TaxID=2966450 RepID=UPI002147C9FB|nr:hypothetical protein [Geothrix sp. SG10]